MPTTNVNLSKLSNVKIPAGLINATPDFTVTSEPKTIADRACEPIRDANLLIEMSRSLKEHGRYRDNMILVLGTNTGLRVSDLVDIQFSDIMAFNESGDLCFKETFSVFEKKTRNTRKRRKNRYVTLNSACMEAVYDYVTHLATSPSLDDYLFVSMSHNGSKSHMTTRAVYNVMNGLAKEFNIKAKVGTHTLRKTFAYHQLLAGQNDQRRLILLQKILCHSSLEETLDYVGITREEISEAYKTVVLCQESQPVEDKPSDNQLYGQDALVRNGYYFNPETGMFAA